MGKNLFCFIILCVTEHFKWKVGRRLTDGVDCVEADSLQGVAWTAATHDAAEDLRSICADSHAFCTGHTHADQSCVGHRIAPVNPAGATEFRVARRRCRAHAGCVPGLTDYRYRVWLLVSNILQFRINGQLVSAESLFFVTLRDGCCRLWGQASW